MELKREEQLIIDDTAKYQDPYPDNVFMAAISEGNLAIEEAGYEPYDHITGTEHCLTVQEMESQELSLTHHGVS